MRNPSQDVRSYGPDIASFLDYPEHSDSMLEKFLVAMNHLSYILDERTKRLGKKGEVDDVVVETQKLFSELALQIHPHKLKLAIAKLPEMERAFLENASNPRYSDAQQRQYARTAHMLIYFTHFLREQEQAQHHGCFGNVGCFGNLDCQDMVRMLRQKIDVLFQRMPRFPTRRHPQPAQSLADQQELGER